MKELRDGRIQMNNLTKKWCDEVRSGFVEENSNSDELNPMSTADTEADMRSERNLKNGQARNKKRKVRIKLSPKKKSLIPPGHTINQNDTESSDEAFDVSAKN
jgi:hypothetical protein